MTELTLWLTDLSNGRSLQGGLTDQTKDFEGWTDTMRGWSIGPMASSAVIRIDEPTLAGATLGVVRASNHLFLYGNVPPEITLPEIALAVHNEHRPVAPNADGRVEQRFDHLPLHIGRFVLQAKTFGDL